MAFKVNKPSDSMAPMKPKLSSAGKIIIGVIVVLVVLILIFAVKSSSDKKKMQQKQEPLLLAIERSITVTKNSLSQLDADNNFVEHWEELKEAVEKEKDILKKSEKAQEMISYVINLAGENQSVLDELQGAVNRIYVAEKEYKQN